MVVEHEAGRSEVRRILGRFFGNSRERLLLSLLGDEDITPAELQLLKRAIAAAPPDADAVDAASKAGSHHPEDSPRGRNRKNSSRETEA